MLLPMMIVGGLVLLLSVSSIWLAGRWHAMGWTTRLVLLLGGSVDGMFGCALLIWLDLSTVNAVAGGLLLGTLSMVFLQPMVMPQRLMVWRLARENIRRRRRQSALMMAGLILASAIITSSLVVGDSLDETVNKEVSIAWGATDVLISGLDPQTGTSVEFNQTLGERLWSDLQADQTVQPVLDGRQYGVFASVSMTAESGLAEPSISFFGMDAEVDAAGVWEPLNPQNGFRFLDLNDAVSVEGHSPVAINAVAADMLAVGEGDVLELGAFVTRDGGRERITEQVVVHAVVPNTGQGAMAGSRSPAVFSTLEVAQSLLEMTGQLTRISLAFDDGLTAGELRDVRDAVKGHLDGVLTGRDVGLEFTRDDTTSSLTVSSSTGLQRLDGEDVRALRENSTTLYPEASLLEVLQAPLIDVGLETESLLTLADKDVRALYTSSTALWHVASTGVGFEVYEGDAWLWQIEEGDVVEDTARNATGQAMLVAHREGLTLVDEGLEDEDPRATYASDDVMHAVANGPDGWLALTGNTTSLSLLNFDHALSLKSQAVLDVQPPSTVLEYRLLVDDGVYLAVEGLLSTSYYRASIGSTAFFESDASAWPAEDAPVVDEHAACNGIAAVQTTNSAAWCTSAEGLVRWNLTSGEVESMRLPVLSDAPGFGRFPQMLLAFGGENATLIVENGTVMTSQRLDFLDLANRSTGLAMTGLLPYAYGNDSSVELIPEGLYTALPGFEQLRDLDAVVLGLVSLSDAETLALASPDDRSLLMFSGEGFSGEDPTALTNLTAWFDERSDADDLHLSVLTVQLDAAEQAAESSGVLSAMFLVFGTFTIAAGVLLSLTIIMLLADVRRKELASMRALGLRRSDARALFVQEGAVLAFVAGAVGSCVGLGLAYVISVGFQSIFSTVGAQSFSFSWSIDSFLAGWIWGTLLSLILLSSSSAYNAQINIVRALRGGRLLLKSGVPWGVVLVQVLALGGLGLSAGSLLLGGLDGAFAYVSYVLVGVCLISLLTPAVLWELPTLLARGKVTRWTRYAPRNTLGAAGLLFLLWTLVLAPFDPVRQAMQPNELAFIALGLFQVLAGVMVLTSIAPLAVQWLSKQRLFSRRLGPSGAVALAHPLAHPVRTAVVMGMFSITMFSVVVLAGYTEQFETYSGDFVEEAEGEFELLLTSTRSRPIELGDDPSSWGINHSSVENIDAVGRVYRSPVHLEDADGERMPYILRGVDEGFVLHGGLPLHVWDDALGSTSQEAWMSISQFQDVVFLDASFGLESTADGTGLVPLQFSIGDSISLIDFSNPKNTKTVRVGGFLQQSSYLFSPGVWMSGEIVDEQFGGEVTRMYVSVGEEAVATEEAYQQMELLGQGKAVQERQAAAELENVLDMELSSYNINVQTVADEVMVIQSLVLALLSLFEGYLALGLIVGVAGIGVVTVRNVSERRQTVGMLRAIGFRQRHVLRMFSIEVSWVAVLGMLNGLAVGYGFHLLLFKSLWEAEGVVFSFPWVTTLGLFGFGWMVVLLTTYVPVRQAANIPPSAALRSS